MIASKWIRWGSSGIIALALVAAAVPLPRDLPALAQNPATDELPDGPRFVPADAALIAYVDADKIWNCDIVKSIRKADTKTFDMITGEVKKELGITPEDVKSLVLFVPTLKRGDSESFAVV